MSELAVVHLFLNSFGVPAYEESSVRGVDVEAEMPYITYPTVFSVWEGEETPLGIDLWYHTGSNATINAKVSDISERLSNGGVILPCVTGGIWVKRGTPFAQGITDDRYPTLKRRRINLVLEFLIMD